MKPSKLLYSTLLLAPALTLASVAQAEYKCNLPQHGFDRVACEKAAQGPDALRRYIARMQSIQSLQFSDYVNEAQARQWAEAERDRAAAPKERAKTAPFQAATTRA